MQAELELLQDLAETLTCWGIPESADRLPEAFGESGTNLQFIASGLLFVTAMRKKLIKMSEVCYISPVHSNDRGVAFGTVMSCNSTL